MIVNILAVIGALTILCIIGCVIALYMIVETQDEYYESESDLYNAREKKIYDELRENN